MKRNRYCYCNVCSNKVYNDKQILICKKSGHIPDFGITCNNYKLDEAECKNVENKLFQQIEKKVRRPDFIEEINLKTVLFEKEKCQDYTKLPERMIFKTHPHEITNQCKWHGENGMTEFNQGKVFTCRYQQLFHHKEVHDKCCMIFYRRGRKSLFAGICFSRGIVWSQ